MTRIKACGRRDGDNAPQQRPHCTRNVPDMNTDLSFIAAFTAGLVGSAHCLGMCGGIAAALGMSARSGTAGRGPAAGYALLFGVGRVSGYMIIGALAGWLGQRFAGAVDVPTWSAVTRIATGLMLLLIGLQVAFHLRLLAPIEQGGARIWRRIAPLARRFVPVRGPHHALALGLLWGWLPCGLVYSVVLLAMLAGSPLDSALLMGAFGLGTLPSMTAVTLSSAQLGWSAPQGPLRRLAGVVLVIFGLWTAAVPLQHLTAGHDHGGHMHHEHSEQSDAAADASETT
jgi:sulfite exporter TauE/SafE